MKKSLFYLMVAALPLVATSCDKEPEGVVDPEENPYTVSEKITTLPEPPAGQRWVLNAIASDEFDGTALDTEKWFERHPTWNGRPPAYFDKEMATVEDGYLVLRLEEYDTPKKIYNSWSDTTYVYTMGSGAIMAKTPLLYGYFESKFRTHSTPCAAGFWMSSNGRKYQATAENQPAGLAGGTYNLELDICETVGREHREGDLLSSGKEPASWSFFDGFGDGMNYNVHFWYTPAGAAQIDYGMANAGMIKRSDNRTPDQDFNTYATWWKDKEKVEFYYNGVSGGERDFITKTGQPFWVNEPMNVILNIETYDWAPVPNGDDFDPARNRTQYEYFRHYLLVGVDDTAEAVSDSITVGEMPWLESEIYLPKRPRIVTIKSDKLALDVNCVTNSEQELSVTIYDLEGKAVDSYTHTLLAGYSAVPVELATAALTDQSKYYMVARINDAAGKELCGDSYQFTCSKK